MTLVLVELTNDVFPDAKLASTIRIVMDCVTDVERKNWSGSNNNRKVEKMQSEKYNEKHRESTMYLRADHRSKSREIFVPQIDCQP